MLFEVSKTSQDVLIELTKELPDNCTIVNIDNMDANEIVQLVVEITRITAPLIAGYFLGVRNSDRITVKIKGKVDTELTLAINQRSLKKVELVKMLLERVGICE